MGGRGSVSGKGGGGGAPEKQEREKTPIEKALGEKGAPYSPEEAAIGANPHYRDGEEYRINCQRCIYAWEMRRRGYNVEALPNNRENNDRLPNMYAHGGWPEVMGASVQDLIRPAPSGRNCAKKMAEQMAEFGDGARAIVRVKWKHGRSGHVFCAEQVNGQTKYYDPQTGKPVDISHYLGKAKPSETRMLRIDNREPTELITKCVKPKT